MTGGAGFAGSFRTNTTTNRHLSVDALRGADMLLILGVDYVVHYLYAFTGAAPIGLVSDQLRHADWVGVNAYDIVFPVFIFLSGLSLGLVTAQRGRPSDRRAFVGKAARRALILGVLGILYNWGWRVDFAEIRIPSVLGLIGGAYFIAALAVSVTLNRAALCAVVVAILVAVAVLQLAVPFPGGDAGVLTPESAINGWVDRTVLPGRLHGGAYDPEGLLGVFSSGSIAIAGLVAGLSMPPCADGKSAAASITPAAGSAAAARFAVIGVCLMGLGAAIAPFYPPIKKIWTASFDVVAIGACLVLMAGSIMVFDVWRFKALGTALGVVGANAILAYFSARYLVYPAYGPASALPPALAALLIAALVALLWAGLAALYRRRLFLRV